MNEAAAPTFFPFIMHFYFFFPFCLFCDNQTTAKKKKEHETLVSNLQKGDEVMTSSGLVGKVENIKDRFISVRLNENVSINMQKEFISSQLPKGTINSIESQ